MNALQGSHVPCIACGSRDAVERPDMTAMVRSRFLGSAVVRCRGCGLSFLSPVPTGAALEGMYEEDYFDAYREAHIALPAEHEDLPRRYLNRLEAADRGAARGRVLDVGIGHAAFLNLARAHGWEVHGLEISGHAVRHAQARFGIDVIHGTLDSVRLPSSHYDLVHMSHVLEHLVDPLAALSEIRRILKPGGLVAIEVPNEFDNLYVRVRKIARVPLAAYQVASTHIWFFTPRSLRRVVTAADFEINRLITFRDTHDVRPLRRAVKSAFGIVERLTRTAPLIELIARKPREQRTTDGGESA